MTQESNLTADMEDLRTLRHHLSPSAQPFITSLLQQFDKKGYLSEKQNFYVRKYAAECRSKEAAQDESRRDTVEEVFDGSKIRTAFISASKSIKFPRVRLRSDDFPGGCLQFHLATERSKNPGWVIASNGKAKPNYYVYASVDLEGKGNIRRDIPGSIKKAIRDFAKAPAEFAGNNGRETKSCCFCGLQLTHPISRHHGYGPICAAKYNLPWEASTEQTTAAKNAEVELYPLDGTDPLGKLGMEDL